MSDQIDKTKRQRHILDIIRSEPIATQEDLADALGHRGVVVTQSTLSRDLRQLRVTRVPTEEGYRYRPADAEPEAALTAATRQRLGSVAALEILWIEANEVMVVIQTMAGRAEGIAAYLDSLGLEEVLGTVAGDDTVMILPRTIRRTAAIRHQVASLLGLE